jgi:hypothetical protein
VGKQPVQSGGKEFLGHFKVTVAHRNANSSDYEHRTLIAKIRICIERSSIAAIEGRRRGGMQQRPFLVMADF